MTLSSRLAGVALGVAATSASIFALYYLRRRQALLRASNEELLDETVHPVAGKSNESEQVETGRAVSSLSYNSSNPLQVENHLDALSLIQDTKALLVYLDQGTNSMMISSTAPSTIIASSIAVASASSCSNTRPREKEEPLVFPTELQSDTGHCLSSLHVSVSIVDGAEIPKAASTSSQSNAGFAPVQPAQEAQRIWRQQSDINDAIIISLEDLVMCEELIRQLEEEEHYR